MFSSIMSPYFAHSSQKFLNLSPLVSLISLPSSPSSLPSLSSLSPASFSLLQSPSVSAQQLLHSCPPPVYLSPFAVSFSFTSPLFLFQLTMPSSLLPNVDQLFILSRCDDMLSDLHELSIPRMCRAHADLPVGQFNRCLLLCGWSSQLLW